MQGHSLTIVFFCGKIDMRQNFNNCTGIATGIIADGLTGAAPFEICGGRLEGRAREGGPPVMTF